MSEPRRVGLMNLLQSSTGCQFVIPVYQRNYTWSADREVKQFLSDLTKVLSGTYKNHFLGILIYLENSIDFSTREFSIIDGQQRLTTTFLTIYAARSLFKEQGDITAVQQLDGQFLTNPYHPEKIKYKLKPLVADDDVYRCIVEERMEDIDNQNSTVLKNYNYIKAYLKNLIANGQTLNNILQAMEKLYVVCVPIAPEDNAQKIFESINATGIKLTAADLIRNFLLMNLTSDIQETYYAKYWKKIEDNVSSDSKDLEMFFRMYLAIKTYTLVSKNSVYRSFVDWVEYNAVETETLFKNLLEYAKVYNDIVNAPITSIASEIQFPLINYRKIDSDIPLSFVMELYRLYQLSKINAETMGSIIHSINSYLLRRSICDMDSQNISRLFPTVLKKVVESCIDDYSNIIAILNQELVGNTAGTSANYMPNDQQMHDSLLNANVYKRPALRIILDYMETIDNPAPVDLSKLSIEHLMPQTPTDEWLAELDTDEETYVANLHRLGNLTLAAKSDNSKMSNLGWKFKNAILENTLHLKMNAELYPIEKWNLACIEDRTIKMIDRICTLFPYPEVKAVLDYREDIIDEKVARKDFVKRFLSDPGIVELKKNNIYKTADNKTGYIILASRNYKEGENDKYWFAFREARFERISDCSEHRLILICRNKSAAGFSIPRSFFDDYLNNFNNSIDSDGNILHYHIVLHITPAGKSTILLSRPEIKKVDVSTYRIF